MTLILVINNFEGFENKKKLILLKTCQSYCNQLQVKRSFIGKIYEKFSRRFSDCSNQTLDLPLDRVLHGKIAWKVNTHPSTKKLFFWTLQWPRQESRDENVTKIYSVFENQWSEVKRFKSLSHCEKFSGSFVYVWTGRLLVYTGLHCLGSGHELLWVSQKQS